MRTRVAPVVVRPGRVRGVVAGVLLVVWAVWLGAHLWVGPWRAAPSVLERDVAAGHVTAWNVQDRNPDNPAVATSYVMENLVPTLNRRSTDPDTVVWRDDVGRTRWTVPPPGAAYLQPSTGSTSRGELIRAWLGRAVPGAQAVDGGPGWLAVLGAVFRVLWFSTLLIGPPPTRANRWYWFWVGGVPLGLGVAAFAAREQLRAVPSAAVARRNGGWRGVGTAFAASLVVGVLVGGAEWLLVRGAPL